jgi:uncharacterized membrane protein YhaH (DUF805 family)
VNFFQAISLGFRNYANFSSRAVRSEYWYLALFMGLVYQAASLLDKVVFPANSFIQQWGIGPFYVFTCLVLFLPIVAVSVRRLHDLDRTGWWALLPVTIIGGFVLLYWFCKPGTSGPNRFGPDRMASLGPEVPRTQELSKPGLSDTVHANSPAIQAMSTEKRWMPTWLRVLLITLGVIVLAIAATALGGYFWWQNQSEALMVTIAEADKFGADKSRLACVDEAVVRIKKGNGFTEAVKVRLFLKHCLKAAKPAAGFCVTVPAKREIMKSMSWQQEQSQKYGLKQVYEQGVLAELQDFCESEAAK